LTTPLRLSWTDVRDEIRARILTRAYPLGARLPRDEDIAAAMGCTRTTVQRAMQDLAAAGLIERVRKGGTHVKADPITRATIDIPITRREVEAAERAYSYRLIARDLGASPLQVLGQFGLDAPREMLRVRALHLADDLPYIYEDRWVDLTACPEILTVDLAHISANEWLVRHKPYTKVTITFSAIAADADLAAHLACPLGAALLVTDRTTWNANAPITTVQSVAAAGYRLMAKS
jgi:GntR family histidine utilization transcriptional repressor